MSQSHFLLVAFPAQGHINPSLQFAKRLISLGAHVTFVTSISAYSRMACNSTPINGLSFASFSDGYDDGIKPGDDDENYLKLSKQNGSKTLTDLIVSNANQGRPFNCLIHALLLPWVADVAREHHLPSVLLWIQPAMVLDIYYYYFNGFANIISDNNKDPSCLIQLPGLPLLTSRDLPSFLLASNTYRFALPTFQAEFEALEKDTHPRVLVNTFDALEPEALKEIKKFNLVGVGPLIPSAFLDGKDLSDKSFGGDLIKASKDHCYIEWLNSKDEASVVYVSFGSFSVLKKPQMEELGRGILDSGHSFLWVIRDTDQNGKEEKEMEKFSCREELEEKGMIVSWCSQVEVLSHPSVGCFVTHCGWNSSLESLVSGVPVVGFPQWTDQGTNAKLIQDVWKTGVRVEVNKDGIVQGDEIKRCLELVLGDGVRGEEMRRNAKKWKKLAREAAKEGGSSYNNLKAFVDEIGEDKEVNPLKRLRLGSRSTTIGGWRSILLLRVQRERRHRQ